MTDIPQEVREAASRIADRICGCADRKQHLADIELLLAYREDAFLAGKRAGAEEEKRHQDFVTATAYECGHKAGMERAAEIAERELAMAALANEQASSDWIDGFEFAGERALKAIRSENDG